MWSHGKIGSRVFGYVKNGLIKTRRAAMATLLFDVVVVVLLLLLLLLLGLLKQM